MYARYLPHAVSPAISQLNILITNKFSTTMGTLFIDLPSVLRLLQSLLTSLRILEFFGGIFTLLYLLPPTS